MKTTQKAIDLAFAYKTDPNCPAYLFASGELSQSEIPVFLELVKCSSIKKIRYDALMESRKKI